MRIGTWNLDGSWTRDHEAILTRADCDVWLLTEVPHAAVLSGFAAVRTIADMAAGRSWAAVLSRLAVTALPDPHEATAACRIGDVPFLSSVLPWRSSGGGKPWEGGDQAQRTIASVDALLGPFSSPLVWGGDFNHALRGPEVAGSAGGARHITSALQDRGMRAATVGQRHHLPDVLSIDHVAVPASWSPSAFTQVVDRRLSDHDVYGVEVSWSP